jgi:hypothetical protein
MMLWNQIITFFQGTLFMSETNIREAAEEEELVNLVTTPNLQFDRYK